jgi:tetratricopeptide (TPR) repeat protein
MQGRYSDAELLYKDLSDQFNSAQIGAQSKFHMARLNYFRGDFSLAKAQLKILKDNASNNISNDAIDLFLRIEDNMGLDTSKVALQRFAAADLLIYQNRYDTALTILDSLRRSYPDHRLVDEILWEKANIYLDQGHTDRGLQLLDQIIAEHSDGILADDALFTKGKLYQESLEQPDKAKEHFMQILMQHPSSLYKVEARKRIRDIRGDGEAMRQPD